MAEPLKVLIVEDEALLAMELEMLIEQAGHKPVGWATTSREAREIVSQTEADVAFVDLHLADGVTGLDVAAYIRDRKGASIVFVTANPKRVPPDYAGAIGIIAKPFSMQGLHAALEYIRQGLQAPPPNCAKPAGFDLAPTYRERWHASL